MTLWTPFRWTSARAAPGGRDNVLVVILAVLNLASLYTTVHGAREILPWPVNMVVGGLVQAMLFVLLAGFAGQHAPLRRWLVVSVLSMVCVYCSFFTYYGELSDGEDLNRQHGVVEAEHNRLVREVFAGRKSEADRAAALAEELAKQANAEVELGGTTGRPGYGEVGREMMARANEQRLLSERLMTDVQRLEPLFDYDLTGLTPKEVHSRDLAAWSQAPPEWTARYPEPSYLSYVDPTTQVKFLVPFRRVREGDTVALIALGLATFVDGMAILLGTAIERRSRRMLPQVGDAVAGWITDFRGLCSAIWRALSGSLDAQDDVTRTEALLVQLPGREVEFLETFADAVHPENGHLHVDGLRQHPLFWPTASQLIERMHRQAGRVVDRDGDQFVVQHQQIHRYLHDLRTRTASTGQPLKISLPSLS
jgi:hypothetical protein